MNVFPRRRATSTLALPWTAEVTDISIGADDEVVLNGDRAIRRVTRRPVWRFELSLSLAGWLAVWSTVD